MKKRLTIPLIIASLTMAICTGVGAALVSNNQSIKPAEAAVSIGIDSIGNNCYYFSQSGRDADFISLSTMSHCTDNNYYENTLLDKPSGYSEGPTLTLTTPTTQTFDVLYVPLRAYVTTPAYNLVKFFDVKFNFTMKKISDGGSAPAIAELFYLEGQSTPSSFNTANNDTASNSNSIKRLRSTNNTQQSGTATICTSVLAKENPTSSSQNISVDLGLLIVGCYGSSYANAVQITLNVSSNNGSFDEKEILCNGKLYDDFNFNEALNEFNGANNRTLTLLKDITLNVSTDVYRTITKSGTIELNGHKLTSSNLYVFSITSNASITIQNGSLEGTGNCSSAITVASGCSLTIPNTVTITSIRQGINNSGTLTFKGTINSVNTGIINNAGASATITSSNVTTTSNGSSAMQNAGTMIINSGTYKSTGDNGRSLFISNAAAVTNLSAGISMPNGIYVGDGAKAQHLYLYYVNHAYTGSTINLTFANGLVADDAPFYALNSSDTSKVNITNTLPAYLGYTYNSSSKAYVVTYNKYSLNVNMTHGNYTVTKTSNIIYTDTVTITFTLDAGYVVNGANITFTPISNCYLSYDADNSEITITQVRADITVNINPVLRSLTYRYDGNPTTSLTTNAGREGYIENNNAINCTYGDTITVLMNAFRYDGYLFVNWNTEADGTGQSYDAGDTFVITESTVLYAQWVDADYAVLDEFVTNYMHLSDYNTSRGYCRSYQGGDGYYIIAKRALVQLTENQITVFRTDNRYYSAKNRYEAWAFANDDLEYAYVNDFTHISNTRDVNIINNSNTLVIVAIVSAASLTAVGLFFFIRKKKHQ